MKSLVANRYVNNLDPLQLAQCEEITMPATYDDPSYDNFTCLKCINVYERDVDFEPPEDIEYEDNDEERITTEINTFDPETREWL